MKMKKWTKITILGTLMGTCFTAGVYAQDVLQRVDAYLRSDFNVVVNGQQVKLANPPLIYNNSSYLPVKELGSYLGAVVNWQDSTKTIYINPRINPGQPEEGNETNYTNIVFQYPIVQYFDYLGATYPVLTNMTEQAYYRLTDVERMGVKTAGMRKAKEKYSEELYVGEDELKKVWGNNPPQISYANYDAVTIIGEKDPVKRKAINDYVESFRYYELDKVQFATSPIIVDALPELNTYSYLLSENGHYYRTTLKLTQVNGINNQPDYVVGSSSKEDIQVEKIRN
ncbi:stalk domain-containing protein [Paenibacillus aceris]|uniref:Copper amine oxidase-like N-terminal domain-containing protein n=1 Tax=Paenibacillus aceris TaxID=869555 RepID=A0ABS4HTE7_9BACL|nr:stalk domain-containing protein [Paenibacillus aceris]MBP1961299.1 hypothetical protein [Paenibacillus aceris]NHW37913.1 copper amine oxidase N-terminal domain-containing protein [Paenibacillus aceris]